MPAKAWHVVVQDSCANAKPRRPCLQVGMATTFEFWAFPDGTRLRLSQIFVPPAHQHVGVGRALLEAVYRTAAEREALDVTVSLLSC